MEIVTALKNPPTVVTGATDGIGREFSLQLGKAGFNVFLASRSAEKLNAFAAELGVIIFFAFHDSALMFLLRVSWGPNQGTGN
jgi:NADP-dependent 3-hydroxy acid dehydrogenase YdfG